MASQSNPCSPARLTGAEDWPALAERLEDPPEREAKHLFWELTRLRPGVCQEGQFRTFQRRIQVWQTHHGPDTLVELELRRGEPVGVHAGAAQRDRRRPVQCSCRQVVHNWRSDWAHSYHVARQPIKLDDGIPLGTYLAQWYGEDFAALDVTVGNGVVRAVEFNKDGMVENANPGFRVDLTMHPAAPASIEGILGTAFTDHTVLLDVHKLSDVQRPRRMRALGWDYHTDPTGEILNYLDGPLAAFDQVLYLPMGSAAKGLKP